jgi:hypothetical protein
MKKYYSAYQDARSRCNNPNNKNYPNYGGRGIKFCFTSYEEFATCLGEKPFGYTLDRINNNGHYEAGNIQWASRQQQNTNRRAHKQHSAHKDSVTGLLGICYDKNRDSFIVRKKNKYIGRYTTIKEAQEVWLQIL